MLLLFHISCRWEEAEHFLENCILNWNILFLVQKLVWRVEVAEFIFIDSMLAKVGRFEVTLKSVTGAITESIACEVTGSVTEES